MSADPPPDQPSSSDTLQDLAMSTSASVALPADLLADVEREQALADLQALLQAREEELGRLRKDKEKVVTERDAAASVADQFRSQLTTLQSKHFQTSSELSVSESRNEASEREKRELVEEIQRLQERSNKAARDTYDLQTQRTAGHQKIAKLEVEVSELKMAYDSAKFIEERSVQALQNARKEVSYLTTAQSEAESRHRAYRTKTQSDISQLQQENELLQGRIIESEQSQQSLRRTFQDQSRRLGKASDNIATLTQAAATQKANFLNEFDKMTEQLRILEKRGEEAREAVADRESELERRAEENSDKERTWEERWKREERGRKEAEKRADDLKLVVERLAMAGGDGFGSDISPAASLAVQQRLEGKSYTQFFTDYTLLEAKLRSKEEEITRLTALLEEISQDIAEKKPLLDEQAAEHDQAIERANTLAGELAAAIAARDSYENRVKALEAASTHHTEEVAALQSTADDLARQVQALLREIAIRDDPSLAHVRVDDNSTVSEDLVTDRLLEFKSLRGLQEQNQRLLKVTRGLMAKLDQREIRRASNDAEDVDTAEALDKATETITRLHKQLLEAQKKINDTTRERDLFSKLLARGEGLRFSANGTTSKGPLDDSDEASEQAIATLQAELSSVRDKAEEDITEAKELARRKSEEARVAEVERVKADAKAMMLEEQQRILSDTHELQRQQYQTLENQLAGAQAQLQEAQRLRHSGLEEVASYQSQMEQLRTESLLLRAEKEQWESLQSRRETHFNQVSQERAELKIRIDSLDSVNAANERTRSEERSALEKRIEDLQKEVALLRAQVDEAREGTRAAEAKLAETDVRIAAETATIRSEKEAVEAMVATKTTEIEALSTQIENTKRVGLNWQRRAKELGQQAQDRDTAHATALGAKETEAAAAKTELDEAKAKLAESEKRVGDMERASQLKDGTVQRLQSELAAAKHQGQTSGTDTSQLTAMTTERDALQHKLANIEKELEAAKAAAATASTAATPATPVATPTPAAPTETAEGGAADTALAELQAKFDDVSARLKEKDEQYDQNVNKVNRVNKGLSNKVNAMNTERAQQEARIAELEKEKAELEKTKGELEKEKAEWGQAAAQPESAPATEATTTAIPDQTTIDEAVRVAVSKREEELKAEHATALASVAPVPAEAKPDPAAIDAAVAAKETELKAKFDKELAEARAGAPAASAAPAADSSADAAKIAELTEENTKLQARIAELEAEIKTLKRQNRTGDITRKTLERQKADAEARAKANQDALEAAGLQVPAAAGVAAASSPAPAAAAAPAAASAAAPAAALAAAPAAAPAAAQVAAAAPAAAPAAATLSPAAVPFKPVVAPGAAAAKLPPKPMTRAGAAAGSATKATSAAAARASSGTASPPTSGAAAVRGGAARGRGRGGASVRGRGAAAGVNSVLSSVNATLANSEGGTKRPAPDEDAAVGAGNGILQRIANPAAAATAAAADTSEGATRAAKRPRGGAAGRGRGRGRGGSAAGGGDGGA